MGKNKKDTSKPKPTIKKPTPKQSAKMLSDKKLADAKAKIKKIKPEGKKSSDPIPARTAGNPVVQDGTTALNSVKKNTTPLTIDVPRTEGEGVITINEPVDRPVHWTDGWKAEVVERERDSKTFRCLNCDQVRTRAEGEDLPESNEHCSHEWEEVQCHQGPGSTNTTASSSTPPSGTSVPSASTASPTSSSSPTVGTPTTSAVTMSPQTKTTGTGTKAPPLHSASVVGVADSSSNSQGSSRTGTAVNSPNPSQGSLTILQSLFKGNTTTAGKPSFGERVGQIQQEHKIAASANPRHMVVTAFAGTGKTSTLVEGLKLLKEIKPYIIPSDEQRAVWNSIKTSKYHKFVCFAAFNSGIATELRERVPPGVDAKTMHSLGLAAVRKAFKLPDDAIDRGRDRIPDIVAELLQTDVRLIRKQWPTLMNVAESLVELCKSNLVNLNSDGDPDYWHRELEGLVYEHDIEIEDELVISGQNVSMISLLTTLVPAILERCKDVGRDRCITFTDMIWLPVVLDLPMFKFDILFVDEAQDLNKCQHALIKKVGRRLILCGDPNQSIYGFAGADSESIPRITEYLRGQANGCDELKLTVTRRCAKAIVREANEEVPEFTAHPDNPEGKVETLKYPLQPVKKPGGERGVVELPVEQTYLPRVEAGDMVLCRSVAPLVGQYFKFLKMGKAAFIQGKDLAQQIINLITKMKASSIPDLVGKLDDWLHDELEKEQAKRNPRESFMQGLKDKYDCAKFFTEETISIQDAIKKIEAVFVKENSGPGIRLMTIHKAKGLESKRVFYLRPAVVPTRREDKMLAWQRREERNLRYVAKTRAIEELYYVV